MPEGRSLTLLTVPRIWRTSARALCCLVSVAAITYACFSVFHVNGLVAGFADLLLVLVVAARWGRGILPISCLSGASAYYASKRMQIVAPSPKPGWKTPA